MVLKLMFRPLCKYPLKKLELTLRFSSKLQFSSLPIKINERQVTLAYTITIFNDKRRTQRVYKCTRASLIGRYKTEI